jgi:hypothetical protein
VSGQIALTLPEEGASAALLIKQRAIEKKTLLAEGYYFPVVFPVNQEPV